MKKIFALVSVLSVLLLAACGGGNSSADENTITVGASSVPHAEILEEAKPLLDEEGITLEVDPYEDYVLPNDDLASGEIDANYFQHIPFLQQTINDTGYDLDYIDGIHIEPIGVYSKSIASIDDIPDGTEVLLSNSVPDHGRILALFEDKGIIKLDESVEKEAATVEDIVENPNNLQFSPDYDAAMLPELYETEEDTLVVINTNYAIGAELNPEEDAVFIEGKESKYVNKYVNVIAVQSDNLDNEALNKLVEVLQSEEIKDFILKEYKGAVVPVSGE